MTAAPSRAAAPIQSERDRCRAHRTLALVGLLVGIAPFAQPANAQTFSKTEVVEYHDNQSKWVLGQQSKLYVDGVLASETSFNALAQPLWQKSFGALERSLEYYADGTLKSVADARHSGTFSTKIVLSSWMRGIPQRIDYPATPDQSQGAYKEAAVNSRGELQSVIDENGYQTCYTYDALGRLRSIAPASNAWTCDEAQSNWNKTNLVFEPAPAAYGLPAGHWRHVVTTGNGAKIIHFDAMLRPVVEESYDAGLVSTTKSVSVKRYDVAGRLKFQSYPVRDLIHHASVLFGTHTEYDSLDRVTAVRQDGENGALLSTTTVYLPGLQTSVKSARGQSSGAATVTSFMAYDQPSYELPVLAQQPEGVTTHILRDAFGKPAHIVRTDGQSLWDGRYFVYDQHQRLCKQEEMQGGASAFGYDAAGNLAWSASGLPWTGASNLTCHHTQASVAARRVDRSYDQRGRIKTLSFASHTTGAGNGNQSWTYTPDSLPSIIRTQNVPVLGADPKETINTYLYNTRRLLTDESVTVVGPSWSVFPLHYGYDHNGNLASHTYPTGHQVVYSPDALGRPTQVVSPSAAVTYASNIVHHPNGATASFLFGNGIAFQMQQNARQLPARVTHGPWGAASSNPSLILDNAYEYDANGNVGFIGDYKRNAAGHRWMDYDNLDRLTHAGSATFGQDHHLYFTYDILDNIRSWKTPTALRRDNYCYDARNRLEFLRPDDPSCTSGGARVAFGYDERGNVAFKNGQTFQFDLGNRLREASSSTSIERYRYDGHGRRVLASRLAGPEPSLGTILSQYSQSGQLMYQSNFRAEAAKDTEYIYLSGTLLAQREVPQNGTPGAVKFQHTDALGTPAAITNSAGGLIERMDYNPYGGTTAGSLKDAPGFTGHPLDRATGMSYMQQRYYDPEIGRFLSVDPVTADASTGGNFNRYWYANNNPYKFTDPDGRAAITWGPIGQTALTRLGQAGATSLLDSPAPGPADIVAAGIVIYAVGEIGYNIYQAAVSDTPESAADKIKSGTSAAAGVSGKKGELEGTGGQSGADGAFDSANGSNERSPREGVRVKDLDGGGTIETHGSTKSPDYPQGTPTVKIQGADKKPVVTVRYPEPSK